MAKKQKEAAPTPEEELQQETAATETAPEVYYLFQFHLFDYMLLLLLLPLMSQLVQYLLVPYHLL